MNRKRILFVDDEPFVLQGLQRMLRNMRSEWDMVFAEGADQALRTLEEQSFDVVVSDLRMPGMNGAELLKVVKERYPTTVRLILSGHADKELVRQSLSVAHQYVSKPCDPEQLKVLIGNACLLSGSLISAELKQVLGSIEKLPSIPKLFNELREALEKEDSSPQQLGDLIQRDIAMTAKILKLVNSAFFGLRRVISSPHEAVSYLGVETLKSLVLMESIFEQAHPLSTGLFSLEDLWRHSCMVARIAKHLAEAEGADHTVQESLFVQGILHDVGILVMAQNFPQKYDSIIDVIARDHNRLSTLETEEFGVTHAEVGAYLLGLWGLPGQVLNCISRHHDPCAPLPGEFPVVLVIHAADVLAGQADPHVLFQTSLLKEGLINGLGDPERLPKWKRIAEEQSSACLGGEYGR